MAFRNSGIQVLASRIISGGGGLPEHHGPYDEDKDEKLNELKAKIYAYVGNSGTLQWLLLFAGLLTQFATSMPLMLVSFAAPAPLTQCPDERDPTKWVDCSEVKACERLSQGLPAKVEFEYDNWTKTYGVYCDKENDRNFAQSLLIFCSSFNCFATLFLIDIFGRRFGMILTFVTTTAGALAAFLVDNFTIKFVGLGIAYGSDAIYSALFTIFFIELLSPKAPIRKMFLALNFTAYPMGGFFLSIMTFFTKDPWVLSLFVLVACAVSSVIPVLICPESPMYLLNRGKMVDFIKCLAGIRNFNRVAQNKEELDHISIEAKNWFRWFTMVQKINVAPAPPQAVKERPEASEGLTKQLLSEEQNSHRAKESSKPAEQSSSSGSKAPILKLISNFKYLYYLITISLVGTLLNIIFNGVNLNLTELGSPDVSVDGIIYSAVSIGAYLLMTPFAGTMKRKTWVIIFQVVFLVCGVLLTIIDRVNTGETLFRIAKISLAAGVFGGGNQAAFIPYYYLVTETFPIDLRGTGSSIIVTCANGFSMVAPFFISLASHLNVSFALGCSALAVLTVPLSFFLRETVEK